MTSDQRAGRKNYAIHIIGGDKVLSIAATGFSLNQEKGIIEFSDPVPETYTVFLRGVAYIQESALVDPASLRPKQYGRSRS